MLNRWQTGPVLNASALDQLVYQSRMVGEEESLVLWGGGNNSVKEPALDLLGQPVEVMYIKGSGSDMKSIVPAQYPRRPARLGPPAFRARRNERRRYGGLPGPLPDGPDQPAPFD
jgi:rhamnose utilization protein RhaD (predicted bifunctional aldolase and dehydrogenase)